MTDVLVTGGAGFIGSNTVDALLESGYSVAVVDDLSTGKKKNLNKKAKFIKADITSLKLAKAISSVKPEKVMHLAAHIDVRKSVREPMYDARINVLGTINLLDACAKAKVEKIVYASSGGAVYGEPARNPPNESHPITPLCPYGASKYAAEKYVELYSLTKGLDYNILRYGNVYGPRQDPLGEAGVVAIFTKLIYDGKRPTIFGDGLQTRDFCFVGDVAKANVLALEKTGKSKIYNVGSGKPTSVNEITELLLSGMKSKVTPKHIEPVPGEVRHIFLDIGLIKKELGWAAATSISDGIAKTIGWVSNE